MNIALSPLDDRYQNDTKQLLYYFSEYALFRYRIKVEIIYFLRLMQLGLSELEGDINTGALTRLITDFNHKDYMLIKKHESITKHDVKAVEYYLRDKFMALGLKRYIPFIHFGLTSQDVNNTATSLQIKEYICDHYNSSLQTIQLTLKQQS